MVLAIELITVYKVHEFWSPSRRHSFLTITFVDSCGRFHLNVANITIPVWEHLLNQAHWPVSSQRLLVDNNLRLKKARTWEGQHCPCWWWQFWMTKFVTWCLLGRIMGCFLSNETGAFSKRPPVLNIPSEMKGFKLRIGLDRGTHFLWFPDAL